MMRAAMDVHAGVVEKLVAAGADVNAVDNVSCCEGREEGVLLMSFDVDV